MNPTSMNGYYSKSDFSIKKGTSSSSPPMEKQANSLKLKTTQHFAQHFSRHFSATYLTGVRFNEYLTGALTAPAGYRRHLNQYTDRTDAALYTCCRRGGPWSKMKMKWRKHEGLPRTARIGILATRIGGLKKNMASQWRSSTGHG